MKKILTICAMALLPMAANATTYNFSGTFTSNADSRSFNVSLPTGSLGGSVFTFDSAEGLDPVLSLYDSSMNLLATDDDSGPGIEALLTDSNEPFLPAGNYLFVLSVLNDNLPFQMFDTPLSWNLVFESNSKDMQVSEVPLPAAAWLFASSLMGFAGLRRKSV